MMRKTITPWALLALLLAVTCAYAQQDGERPRDGERPPREGEREPRGPRDGERPGGRDFRPPPPPLMIALDTDKDGTISAEEIAGAVAALKTLDRNEDGKLDHEELRPEPGDHGEPGRGPRDGDHPRPEGDRPPRDGDRPPREGDRPRGDDDRERGDREPGDRGPGGRGPGGPGGPPPGGPDGFVDRLMQHDLDDDGKLSRDELRKAAEAFGRGRGPGGPGRGGREGDDNRPQRPE